MSQHSMTIKDFFLKVLNAAGLAIVIALIPNAILGTILSPLTASNHLVDLFVNITKYMTSMASLLIGVMAALFLGLPPMKAIIVGLATFTGSGVISVGNYFTEAGAAVHVLQLKGLGDLLNAIVIASYTCALLMYIKDKFASLNIILLPIIGGAVCGFIGYLILPIINGVTTTIADGLKALVEINPYIMAMIIGAVFAVVIISPISSVVLAFAVGVTGYTSGIANVAISGTFIILLVGSLFVNRAGISIAIAMGTVKMMVGNLLKYPILVLPLATIGAITGLSAYIIGIKGTTFSAGFGYSGLIGPLAAYKELSTDGTSNILMRILLAYVVVPPIAAVVINYLYIKVLKVYTLDIFRFNPAEIENQGHNK